MIDPRVLEQMKIYMTYEYGNAASNEHAFGWNANEAVNYILKVVNKLKI